MDVFEKIYSNMESAAKQSGRWHIFSIFMSFVLLAVCTNTVAAKNELSFLGISISLSETYLIALLFALY